MTDYIKRKFEIPYNFDIKLIDGINILEFPKEQIDCFYIPPYHRDYSTIRRTDSSIWYNMSRDEYLNHINYINKNYNNKMQLLLQNQNIILSQQKLEYYINLGFTNFCCGTLQQAKQIKDFDKSLKTVASIVMHSSIENINNEYFDAFVLDFSYMKDLEKITKLPKNIEYIMLCNSSCNIHCDGTHHWNAVTYPETKNPYCPGLFPTDISFYDSCMIRPMDLYLFDEYIKIFKLQDRCWPTRLILRDLILYTTNFREYPNIIYDKQLYMKGNYNDIFKSKI